MSRISGLEKYQLQVKSGEIKPPTSCNSKNLTTQAQADEFVSSKPKKKLTTKQKILIGATTLLATSAAVLAGLFLIKDGKLKPAQFKEFIKFTPAKTMEEAREFAIKNFGVEKFDFEDDLEMANWINEGLTNVNNKFKGKAHMPKILAFGEHKSSQAQAFIDGLGEGIYISKKAYDKDANIEHIKKLMKNVGINIKENKITMLAGMDKQKALSFIKKYQEMIKSPDSYTRFQWADLQTQLEDAYASVHKPMRFITDISENKEISKILEKENIPIVLEEIFQKSPEEQTKIAQQIADALDKHKIKYNAQGSDRFLSTFDTIYHEMGHLQNYRNSNYFTRFFGKLSDRPKQIEKFTKDFQKQQIAQKISWYAQKDPSEFVAETFAQMCNGKELDEDILRLYKYYNGVTF
ncbi:MAG: hypothetical protein IJB79_07965 [Candidatus Gastranaerophilales bacterium]|nr:hypothetical protein [Candidatus Gastranaerophilales bacterium]